MFFAVLPLLFRIIKKLPFATAYRMPKDKTRQDKQVK